MNRYMWGLSAGIAALAGIAGIAQAQTAKPFCFDFTNNLQMGNRGPEVRMLAIALKKEGQLLEYSALSASMFGKLEKIKNSNGFVFNEEMASAVVGFQEKYKGEILTPNRLRHGTGAAGPSTRAKLNKLYGCDVKPKPATASLIDQIVPPPKATPPVQPKPAPPAPKPVVPPAPVIEWKSYRNAEYGFSFKYPADLFVEQPVDPNYGTFGGVFERTAKGGIKIVHATSSKEILHIVFLPLNSIYEVLMGPIRNFGAPIRDVEVAGRLGTLVDDLTGSSGEYYYLVNLGGPKTLVIYRQYTAGMTERQDELWKKIMDTMKWERTSTDLPNQGLY